MLKFKQKMDVWSLLASIQDSNIQIIEQEKWNANSGQQKYKEKFHSFLKF